jgi:hypothetical protein
MVMMVNMIQPENRMGGIFVANLDHRLGFGFCAKIGSRNPLASS